MKQLVKTLLIAISFVMLMGYAGRGVAEVTVNIGIGIPLPSVVIPAPPPVLLIPTTYVYFVPDVSVDILFYHGYWYRPHHGHYYRATSYNGPWVSIAPNSVPAPILHVPSDFRRVPPGQQRITHGALTKNWQTWEKERHWDNKGYTRQASEVNGGGKWDNKQAKGGGKKKH